VNGLGALAFDRGKLEEARRWFTQALSITETTVGDAHPDYAIALRNLAAVQLARRRYADAEPLLERSIAVMGRSLGSEHPAGAGGLRLYAELLRATKRGRAARAYEVRARAIVARWHGDNALGHTVDLARLKDKRLGTSALWNSGERRPAASVMPGAWQGWMQPRVERGGQELLSQ
jgi:tetratricopeptide (TPR) repeat protein